MWLVVDEYKGFRSGVFSRFLNIEVVGWAFAPQSSILFSRRRHGDAELFGT